eukprot:3344471-Rhodomonas_salina.1
MVVPFGTRSRVLSGSVYQTHAPHLLARTHASHTHGQGRRGSGGADPHLAAADKVDRERDPLPSLASYATCRTGVGYGTEKG